MTPPHARFKFLSHNRLSRRSRYLFNRAEFQHPSMETVTPVHEDGLGSLDRTRNTSVDGLNQGPEPPEEPEIDRVDCTSSSNDHLSDEQATSTISSFEAEDLSIGSPRHVKEDHIARQQVMISTSIIYETTFYMSVDQTVSIPPSTSESPTHTSPTPTSPTPTPLTPTFSYSTASSASSNFQCDGGCSLSKTAPQVSAQQSLPMLDPSTYTTFSTSSDLTVVSTSDTSAITTTMSLQPVLASSTVSLSNTVMVSSPLAQPTSVPDTNSDPQSSPHTAAIVGGAIGAVALLALLIFIVIWHRRKRRLSVTPFTLPSTTRTAQIGQGVGLNSQSIGDAVRPSSRGPSFVQYSDAGLLEHSGNRYLSFITDSVSSHLPDDDDPFASVIVLGQQSNGLEKLYPSPSRARISDHYRHSSVENWVNQVVLEDCSREPSEVLPAYRSTKSLKSGEA